MSGGGGHESIRTATPPLPGSPDRVGGESSTLKVHLPDGRFNVVRYNDVSDIKVYSSLGKMFNQKNKIDDENCLVVTEHDNVFGGASCHGPSRLSPFVCLEDKKFKFEASHMAASRIDHAPSGRKIF